MLKKISSEGRRLDACDRGRAAAERCAQTEGQVGAWCLNPQRLRRRVLCSRGHRPREPAVSQIEQEQLVPGAP